MNTGHRTIVALLTVVALLLALNLIATTSPAADNASATGPPDPYVVKNLPWSRSLYLRVWSDGRVDLLGRNPFVCTWGIGWTHGPVVHPFPVVDAHPASSDNLAALLIYEDDRVDLVGEDIRCTLEGIGTPSLCTGDTDRDGTVGIVDFLTVLDQWGETCQ